MSRRRRYTIHPWIASLYVDCVPWSTPDGCPLNPGQLRCPSAEQVTTSFLARNIPWSVAEWAVALRFDNPRATVLVLLLGDTPSKSFTVPNAMTTLKNLKTPIKTPCRRRVWQIWVSTVVVGDAQSLRQQSIPNAH